MSRRDTAAALDARRPIRRVVIALKITFGIVIFFLVVYEEGVVDTEKYAPKYVSRR